MLDELVLGKTNCTAIQLARYTFVGEVAFIFDFSTLFFLANFLHIHYLVSAAAAFLIGLTINYLLSVTWVFEKSSLVSKAAEFTIFLLIGLIGLGLNEVIIWFFTGIAGIHYLYSKVISTASIYLWNFFVRKLVLFR